MIGRIQRWWHKRRGHENSVSRVTVPLYDIGAKGLLYRCSCGRTWAE